MKKKTISIILALILCVSLAVSAPALIPVPGARAAAAALSARNGYQTVAASRTHFLAVKDDGSLWEWGSERLALGYTQGVTVTPREVMDDVAAVAATTGISYALKRDGTLWSWGEGVLGGGEPPDYSESTPQEIMDNVVSMSVRAGGGFAIKKDGTLWGWGENSDSELGYDGPSTAWGTDYIDYVPIPVQIMEDVVSVEAGERCTYAIKTDGSLWAWGIDINGFRHSGVEPEPAPVPVKIMDSVASVYGLINCTFALKTDGSLWSWGETYDGVLGDGEETASGEYRDRSNPAKILEDVASVSTYGASMAVKTDGSLWVWGSEYNELFGSGPADRRVVDVPAKFTDGVASAFVTDRAYFYVKTDGSLWAWGRDSSKFGLGNDKLHSEATAPEKVMDGVEYVSEFFGSYNASARYLLKTDGTLWGWGDNINQLLDPDMDDSEEILSPRLLIDGVAMPGALDVSPVDPPFPNDAFDLGLMNVKLSLTGAELQQGLPAIYRIGSSYLDNHRESIRYFTAQGSTELTVSVPPAYIEDDPRNPPGMEMQYLGVAYRDERALTELREMQTYTLEPGIYLVEFLSSYENPFVVIEVYDENGKMPNPAIYGEPYTATDKIGGVDVTFAEVIGRRTAAAEDGVTEIIYYMYFNHGGSSVTFSEPTQIGSNPAVTYLDLSDRFNSMTLFDTPAARVKINFVDGFPDTLVPVGDGVFDLDIPATPPSTSPSDGSPSSWAAEQVNAAIAAKLVPASLQSAYTQATTRAEFCALAVALYENVTGSEITGRTTFDDTDDVNVEKAAYIGVVNGVGNNRFSPDAGLTREQAATMLARLADAVGKPLAASSATFADNSNIAQWALDAVGQMQAAEIMSGVGNNRFDPKGAYTREQSIITIMRLFDFVGK